MDGPTITGIRFEREYNSIIYFFDTYLLLVDFRYFPERFFLCERRLRRVCSLRFPPVLGVT